MTEQYPQEILSPLERANAIVRPIAISFLKLRPDRPTGNRLSVCAAYTTEYRPHNRFISLTLG